jgi:3-oxoacyl-[acyl-carrier protein] reductase
VDLKIRGKIALVTGAGRGIGLEVTKNLLSEGVKVIAVSRSIGGLDLISEKNFEFVQLDFNEKDSVQYLINYLIKRELHPSILINNLGGNLALKDPFSSYTDYLRVLYINLGVAIELNNALIPNMRKNRWGRICHVSSIAALEVQGPPMYGVAKAATNAYVRSVSRYLAAENVVLTSVMPGAIYTIGGDWDEVIKKRPDHLEEYLKYRMASNRLGDVSEISNLITFLVSEYSSFMIGSNILADGGQGRVY